MYRKTLIAATLTAALPIHAETLAPIQVEDTATSAERLPAELLTDSARGETGDLLRQLPGVGGSRMGGHGIDPVVHGQKASRVRVSLEGAEIASGCPNRMDPATSYMDLESTDTVTALLGITTLTRPVDNASGGTLLLERKLDWTPGIHGRASVKKSHLIQDSEAINVNAASERAALRIFGNHTQANNYTDGNGDTVKAEYESKAFGAKAGVRIGSGVATVSAERSRIEDAVYPGTKMDSPYSEANRLSAGYDWTGGKVELYHTSVDHLMDNYSLRTNNGMKRRTPTDTDTTGGSLMLRSQFGSAQITYGVDARYEKKNATFENAANGAALSRMWPNTRYERRSAFAEMTHPFAAGTLKLGARVDQVHTDARDADTTVASGTPRALYQATYGTTPEIRHDDTYTNLLAGWQHRLGSWTSQWTLSSTWRAPDATERYMAKSAGAKSWVGNPNLKAENHRQIQWGLSGKALAAYWQAHLWADWVEDYILKDKAQNQASVAANDGRVIYVNKNAQLRGATLTGDWALDNRTDLTVSATYTYGYNHSDHRNLAGIAPWHGFAELSREQGVWRYGARVNWAADKSDIDPLSPDETGKTPGWATLDLYADWRINRTWALAAGVDNVFDHAYADYLNRRMDPTQGTSYQVNEPGRSVWAKISARF